MNWLAASILLMTSQNIEECNCGRDSNKVIFLGELTFWQPMIDLPAKNRLLPEELISERDSMKDLMIQCWKSKDGLLSGQGDGCGIETIRHFRNFKLSFGWRVTHGSEAVVFLKGCPAIRLRDPRNRIDKQFGLGSGGLFMNEAFRSTPLMFADRSVGEWNQVEIQLIGDRSSVWLNQCQVVDRVPVESFWKSSEPTPMNGPIGFSAVRGFVQFREVKIQVQ